MKKFIDIILSKCYDEFHDKGVVSTEWCSEVNILIRSLSGFTLNNETYLPGGRIGLFFTSGGHTGTVHWGLSILQEERQMNLWELFVIAVGLSMDAFAVSICKGLSMKKMSWKNGIIAGLYFGGFQAGMPLIGYVLGTQFKVLITSIDHWIAFILLCLIGLNMVKEAVDSFRSAGGGCEKCAQEEQNDSFDVKTMVPLAVATSIDALAVGVTFAFLNVDIVPAVSFIGSITFFLSVLGIKIGNVFGAKFKAKAELAGGIILILMGTKILLEHLGILAF